MEQFCPWTIQVSAFSPQELKKNESLFSLGNGYLGLRGNHDEGTQNPAITLEGTYINGFYETEQIQYGEIAHAYAKESQTMLNVTNCKRITVSVDGELFHMDTADIEDFSHTFDMRRGVLSRTLIWVLPDKRKLKICSTRLVSMKRKHIGAIQYRVTPVNFSGEVRICSVLDGNVTNLTCENDPRVGSGLRGKSLSAPVFSEKDGAIYAVQQTKRTGMRVACGVLHRENRTPLRHDTDIHTDALSVSYTFVVTPDSGVTLEKLFCYTDGGADDTVLAACMEELTAVREMPFAALATEQEATLAQFWDTLDLDIEGDPRMLQGLRFNLFHLLQSAGSDGKRNISAKGLSGEGYEGHYFWDTETYILPVFLNCSPDIARALLEYRYHILPQARERAREMGHQAGALFPWRTIDGRECSAYYPAGTAQVHINADIAFAIKRYYMHTMDFAFMQAYGIEILVETARFWCDLGFYNKEKNNRFCIHCVTGPDEYNTLVNNNCYTNLMAQENLLFAEEMLALLRQRNLQAYEALCARLQLAKEEPLQWRAAADAMFIPYDEEQHIPLQDDGFMQRKPWALSEIPPENFPLLLHYHPLVIYRHQVCKQADLILAQIMLKNRFSVEEKKKCFAFYSSVTTHDSSLSMTAFSVLASEIGEREKAYRFFVKTARLDLDDMHGNTKDGLHMANMAGTFVCLASGFAGMHVEEGVLSFAPHLPEQWEAYRFSVLFQGRKIQLRVTREGCTVTLLAGNAISVQVNARMYALTLDVHTWVSMDESK